MRRSIHAFFRSTKRFRRLRWGFSLIGVSLLVSVWDGASATASMNSCNNATSECRANIATIYSFGNTGYVVLSGHLIPSLCTSATWGYYWSLNLTDVADRARYSTLLAAYLSGQPVELRTGSASCQVTAVNLGE